MRYIALELKCYNIIMFIVLYMKYEKNFWKSSMWVDDDKQQIQFVHLTL